MALPFLPGNNFPQNVSYLCLVMDFYIKLYAYQLGRDKFHKSHAFDYNGDVYNFVGEHKSGIGQIPVSVDNSITAALGGQPLPGGKPKPKASVYPKGIGSNKPTWVAFDRQVSLPCLCCRK